LDSATFDSGKALNPWRLLYTDWDWKYKSAARAGEFFPRVATHLLALRVFILWLPPPKEGKVSALER